MKPHASLAIFLIALCGITTGASAEEVYRCGNAYSQKPCPDAVVVDVQDARSKTQKTESDAAVQREAAAGNAMEKARLKAEAQQRADNAKAASAQNKKTASRPKDAASAPAPGDASAPSSQPHKGHAKKKSKKKEPDFFTARAPAEKPKAATSAKK